MRRVIDEFRQLPIEDIAELLVYPVNIVAIDNNGEDYVFPSREGVAWSSNLYETEYLDYEEAVGAVIKYLEQSL